MESECAKPVKGLRRLVKRMNKRVRAENRKFIAGHSDKGLQISDELQGGVPVSARCI